MTRGSTRDDQRKKAGEPEMEVTENGLTEEAFRESEKRYRAVVEDMPAMICRFLPDGTLTFVNSLFCTHYMRYKDDLIGHNFFDLFSPEQKNEVKNHFRPLEKNTPVVVYEHRTFRQDGTVSWQEWTNRALFDENSRIVEYQSIGRDITEQKKARDERANLEKQIQQTLKIEAVGTLAGGIAHDFNNILSAVIGHSELSMLYLPKKSPVRENLKKILEASHRARELVNLIELIDLENEQQPEPVNISLVIRDVLKLMRASMPTSIEIDQNLTAESETVLCNPAQMHQVIMNLCTNAHYSMRDSGGVMSVVLNPIDIDAAGAAQHSGLKPGPYLRLRVSDTGQGIEAENLERIFDPYFSTKEHEVGTGLGLAVVRGIIKKYGGTINVSSKLGKGTSFTVYFPVNKTTENE